MTKTKINQKENGTVKIFDRSVFQIKSIKNTYIKTKCINENSIEQDETIYQNNANTIKNFGGNLYSSSFSFANKFKKTISRGKSISKTTGKMIKTINRTAQNTQTAAKKNCSINQIYF